MSSSGPEVTPPHTRAHSDLTATGAPAAASGRRGAVSTVGVLAALGVLLSALYLIPAANLGLWEPWETSLATLGRHVAVDPEASAFAPFRDGELVSQPWLQTWFLSHGYVLGGGSELGFRLPAALMTLVTALVGFVVLRRFFGTLRAACATLLFASCPVVLLSATNLAGDAMFEGPLTLTLLAAAALIGEWRAARPVAALAIGPLFPLCLLGGGLVGFATPLAILGLYALGAREDRYSEDHALVPVLIGGLLIVAGLVLPLALVAQSGWEEGKDVLGFGALALAPAGLLLAAAPGSRARALFHPVFTPITLVGFALIAFGPLSASYAAAGGFDAWVSDLLYDDFLTGRVLPEHVTYDVLIRIVGASAFPLVIFVPFGFAYLFRSMDGPRDETDDPLEEARAVKQLMTVWMAVGFVIFGLTASLASNYAFPLSMPMAASVGLALGDTRFRKALSVDRVVFGVVGLTAILLLLMTSKDIRGVFDEDAGRPGPHVVFERLLTDGAVAFPPTYAFENVSLFMLGWLLIVALGFGQLLGEPARVGQGLARFAAGRERFARPFDAAARALINLGNRANALWSRLAGGRSEASLLALAFTGLTFAWGVHLAFVDIPNVTIHLSQKGMMDRFESLAGPDAPLNLAGIDASDNSYYLGEGEINRLSRVSELRDLFCEAEGRTFAVVPFDDLAEAHYAVRHQQGDGEEACDASQPFYVIDGRSTRYVLLSNELHPENGEEDESAVGANVFTMDTLPETAQLIEDDIIADGRLKLVAVELPQEPVRKGGELEVVAYWEVRERPTTSYEAFIHVDFGGNRLNGDHDPVQGYYPMRYWVPGEIVRDAHTIEVSRADRAGLYHVYYGFFRGDDRATIVGSASQNRALLGTITIQ